MSLISEIAMGATIRAALASYFWKGKNNQNAADQAAVNAMRSYLSVAEFYGEIVIGEGERDEAPMLYIGEKLGKNINEKPLDIAVDPLEGTALCANNLPGSLSVIAIGKHGSLLQAPDVYMEKIAISKIYPKDIVSLNNDLVENINNLADYKKCLLSDLSVIVLNRPRHQNIIEKLRSLNVKIDLIQDGDISAVIRTSLGENLFDAYVGIGGAPEGVLAAAALQSTGGYMYGKLYFRNQDEKERAKKFGIQDYDRIYNLDELAGKNTIFCASGITSGELLHGVEKEQEDSYKICSIIMNGCDKNITTTNTILSISELNRS